MTDRPIIFSAPMVRALLYGRKTQTRRILKPQPHTHVPRFKRVFDDPPYFEAQDWGGHAVNAFSKGKHSVSPFPPIRYSIGDRLWVREAWKAHSTFNGVRPRDIVPSMVFYLADDDYSPSGAPGRPGIFMPRWASRLTLMVTEVRVQRLNDISPEDADEEGLHFYKFDFEPHWRGSDDLPWRSEGPVEAFKDLWCSIHGPDAWDQNPWVAAISFEVRRGNIDKVDP